MAAPTTSRAMKRLALMIPICLLLAGSIARAALPAEVRALKAVYDKQIERIRVKRDTAVSTARGGYMTGLADREKQFLSAGDLKPLLAVRKEKARVTGGAAITGAAVDGAPDALDGLRKSYEQACKDARLICAESVIELSQHYRARLAALQKDLTREDRIEDALAVMDETEQISNYAEVLQAQKQIAAGGTLADATPAAAAAPAQRNIDTDALADYFHASIAGWNSVTHEVTCTFDFRSEDQLALWEGAGFDALRNRMICDHKTVWLKPAFRSISELKFDGYHYDGDGPLRGVVGKNLYCDVEPGTDGKALLHQGNAFYPLHKSHGGAQPYVRYTSTVTIRDGSIQWSSGRRSFPAQTPQKPLGASLTVGLGHEDANAMFDNITITGILSPAALRAVAEGGE